MKYSDKLKDPRWQKKRLEVLERDEFSCQQCGSDTKTLHVHHLAYSDGEPWDIQAELLLTLCEDCHEEETESLKEANKILISAVKNKGFLSEDIIAFAKVVQDIPIRHLNSVSILALHQYLKSEQNIDFINKSYFDNLPKSDEYIF